MAPAVHAASGAHLQAVASRSPERSTVLDPLVVRADYDALLDDPDVDAVYVCLANDQHAEWVVKALDAGKHVLCEARMAMDVAEALAMRDVARECEPLVTQIVPAPFSLPADMWYAILEEIERANWQEATAAGGGPPETNADGPIPDRPLGGVVVPPGNHLWKQEGRHSAQKKAQVALLSGIEHGGQGRKQQPELVAIRPGAAERGGAQRPRSAAQGRQADQGAVLSRCDQTG